MARLFSNVSTDKITFRSAMQTFVNTRACSAAAWVYTISQAAANPILGTSTAGGPEWRINTSGQMELIKTATGTYATSTGVVPNGKWVHVGITATASGSTITFYINGQPAGSATIAVAFAGVATLTIGNNSQANLDNFNGMIWDFAVWGKTVLTPAEMAQLASGTIRAASLKKNTLQNDPTAINTAVFPLDENKYAGLNLVGPLGIVSGTKPAASPNIAALSRIQSGFLQRAGASAISISPSAYALTGAAVGRGLTVSFASPGVYALTGAQVNLVPGGHIHSGLDISPVVYTVASGASEIHTAYGMLIGTRPGT
jgi:uncharacterized membrane protein